MTILFDLQHTCTPQINQIDPLLHKETFTLIADVQISIGILKLIVSIFRI